MRARSYAFDEQLADAARLNLTLAMLQGPGKKTGTEPEGAAGWSVREARSQIRAAGNAVLAGNRLGPSGPRQLSVPEKRIRVMRLPHIPLISDSAHKGVHCVLHSVR